MGEEELDDWKIRSLLNTLFFFFLPSEVTQVDSQTETDDSLMKAYPDLSVIL